MSSTDGTHVTIGISLQDIVKTAMSPSKKTPKRFDVKKEVRAIARERVGTVKPSRVIVDEKKETIGRKPKHKKPLSEVEL